MPRLCCQCLPVRIRAMRRPRRTAVADYAGGADRGSRGRAHRRAARVRRRGRGRRSARGFRRRAGRDGVERGHAGGRSTCRTRAMRFLSTTWWPRPKPARTWRATTASATATGRRTRARWRRCTCRTRDEGFGAEVKRRIMLGTYVLSAGYYDAYYLKAQQVRTLIRRDYEPAFARVDVVAMPTSPTPAFRLGEKTDDPLQMYLADVFTVSANLSGLPAISVPCGLSAGRLPIGLQLTGRAFDEATLLQDRPAPTRRRTDVDEGSGAASGRRRWPEAAEHGPDQERHARAAGRSGVSQPRRCAAIAATTATSRPPPPAGSAAASRRTPASAPSWQSRTARRAGRRPGGTGRSTVQNATREHQRANRHDGGRHQRHHDECEQSRTRAEASAPVARRAPAGLRVDTRRPRGTARRRCTRFYGNRLTKVSGRRAWRRRPSGFAASRRGR